MRGLLLLAALLVAIAGVQLFILTESTDRYFAWTVLPPISAAFLGAGYWSSCILELLAARQPLWAYARVAVPAALTFTTLTALTTFLHLNRFHFGSEELATQIALWAWLAVYALVPPLLLLALVLQTRPPIYDPPRLDPLPSLLRWGLFVQGLVLFVFGAALFVLPEAVSPLWPWELTPLTARAIAPWLIAIGVAAFHATVENDLLRVRPATVSYLLFGLLQSVALLRYPGSVQWGEPGAWIYVAFLAVMVVTGAVALVVGLRAERVAG
jgi:hypothetical protein